jgi:hypothetical protein
MDVLEPHQEIPLYPLLILVHGKLLKDTLEEMTLVSGVKE